jgi:hypothetical protein
LELQLTFKENVFIGAKKVLDVVVRLLIFQNSFSLVSRAHCCGTSLVVEFSIEVVLAIHKNLMQNHNSQCPICFHLGISPFKGKQISLPWTKTLKKKKKKEPRIG